MTHQAVYTFVLHMTLLLLCTHSENSRYIFIEKFHELIIFVLAVGQGAEVVVLRRSVGQLEFRVEVRSCNMTWSSNRYCVRGHVRTRLLWKRGQ